jgi:hypothetical protein
VTVPKCAHPLLYDTVNYAVCNGGHTERDMCMSEGNLGHKLVHTANAVVCAFNCTGLACLSHMCRTRGTDRLGYLVAKPLCINM